MKNKLNGLILLDKPIGLSSNIALQKVRRILNAEKAGHTGTLDPAASGLLPICLGEATKFAGYLLDGDKEYLAVMQLGIITDSGDSEGNIIAQNPVSTSLEQIKLTLQKFQGLIKQLPPMYSALKHDGVPLYKFARQGIEIKREPRDVNIYNLDLISYDQSVQQLTILTKVSKGTYIRTLAEDIGNSLGCGASLISLRRTKTNDFVIENAYTLDELIKLVEIQNFVNILAIDSLVAHLDKVDLTAQQFNHMQFGRAVTVGASEQLGLMRMYNEGYFIGVGEIVYSDGQSILYPRRLLSNLDIRQN